MLKRALISVYDKQGIFEFAKFLLSQDVELISTGGTYKYLKQQGLAVTEVSEVTQFWRCAIIQNICVRLLRVKLKRLIWSL